MLQLQVIDEADDDELEIVVDLIHEVEQNDNDIVDDTEIQVVHIEVDDDEVEVDEFDVMVNHYDDADDHEK